MKLIKHLTLLAICIIIFGSATESQYLDYSVEELNDLELYDRHIERLDSGFQIKTEIESLNPSFINRSHNDAQDVLYQKGQRSYARKSAYY